MTTFILLPIRMKLGKWSANACRSLPTCRTLVSSEPENLDSTRIADGIPIEEVFHG